MNKLLDFFQKLQGEAYNVRDLQARNDDDFYREYARWTRSARQALEHADLKAFADDFASMIEVGSSTHWQVATLCGIVDSARECIEAGLVGRIRHLAHAEMSGTLVEQAKELVGVGHKTSAAVLCRIVVERWLRDQGEKACVKDWETERTNTLNDALRIGGVYAMPKCRFIQSCLAIGNSAAHGKESEFTVEDVRRMIDFAETNCI